MADGSIVIETKLDDKKAQAELNRLDKKIEDLNAKINTAQAKKMPLLEQAQQLGAQLDIAKEKLYQMQNAPAGFTGDQIAEQKETVKSLQAQWDATTRSVDRYDRQIDSATESLNAARDQAGGLAEQLSDSGKEGDKAGNQISKAIDRATERMGKFEKRIVTIAKKVFVFTLISKALRGLKEYLWENIQTSKEAQAALARLRGALLVLAQPIVNVVIPAFTKLVDILAKVAATAAGIVSKLFGQSLQTTVAQAEASKEARDALGKQEKATKKAGKAAKDASKQLLGFDEIEKLTAEHAEDNTDALEDMAEETDGAAPDFASVIGGKLDGISELFVGLALIALGAIIAFSGANIPLGIGMMVVGALTVWHAISENWDAIKTALQGQLGIVLLLLSGALLVLGAILAFSGANIALGIGLMIAGAIGLAPVVAANWDTLKSVLNSPIGVLVGVLSAALFVIGAIIAFSGANVLLGIGMMVAGAAGLGITVAANWDALRQALQGPIGILVIMLSAALLVIGAILAFSGVNVLLGIGMMAAGAIGIGVTAAVKWDTIAGLLREPIGAIVLFLSTALLVLGAIFTFTGVAIPLGIGMMIAGAVGIGTTVAANWGAIPDLLKKASGGVVAIISSILLVLGLILTFSGVALPLGIGLIVVGAAGLAPTVALNWDSITEALRGAVGGLVAIVSAALLVIGIILLFTGVGIPLGIGLILAGAAGLATVASINWDWLPDKLASIWRAIHDGAVAGWNAVVQAMAAAWETIKQGAVKAWEAIKQAISDRITSLKEKISSFVDNVKQKLQGLASAIKGVGSSIGSKVSGLFGGGSSSLRISSASVPGLASGAVIPPNREFLAVLGDQGSGNNIEAPEALLRQMASEAASVNTELLRELIQAVKAGQVMEIDGMRFGRVVRDAYNTESGYAGSSFVSVR